MAKEEAIKSTIEDISPTTKKSTTPNSPTINKNIQPDPQTAQEPIKKIKPKYKYVSGENLAETIKNAIPKEFVPTKRLAEILGIIFLAVIMLALIQFPFGKLLAGDSNIIIKIGYPMHFLELDILNPENPPAKYLGLFVDIILYLIVSYIIDILINVILNSKLIKSKKELEAKPKVFKSKSPTMINKITQKTFKKQNEPTPKSFPQPAPSTNPKPNLHQSN